MCSPRPRLRLVLATRRDPGLPVARMRLEEQLCELRAQQLRFSAEESALLLDGYGIRLAAGHRAVLQERTGGWPAGLRLAALRLRGHPDPGSFIASFSGDERPVADYLVGEVLERIPEDEREVLRSTSICDPIPAKLAVELSGREDAAELLDRLEHDTGLVGRSTRSGRPTAFSNSCAPTSSPTSCAPVPTGWPRCIDAPRCGAARRVEPGRRCTTQLRPPTAP